VFQRETNQAAKRAGYSLLDGITLMDHSSFVHGMIVSVYLVVLVALLVLFLVWQKVPRRAVFEIVEISVVVFAVSAGISYEIADRVVLNGGDSLLVYIPPVIPVAIYVAWSSRRAKKI
jgi:hypothetical protein